MIKKTDRKEKLGDVYFCLNCREIENLVTKQVLLKVIADYEKLEVDELDIENFNDEDYKKEYLGEFIVNKLNTKNRQGSYQAKSGTITDKLNFCKKVINHTNSYKDLSEEAKELCKRIYSNVKLREKRRLNDWLTIALSIFRKW